jgi:hypothetical protein
MKNLILTLVLLFPMLVMSQAPKGMSKIDIPEEIRTIEVNATVKYASDEGTIIITRNKVDVYEIKTGSKLVPEHEYFFVLRVPTCVDCGTVEAEMLGYEVSVAQSYENIRKLREKIKRQELKED